MTIGQSFEFKIWNYITGAVSQSHEIQLNKDKKQLKNLNVVCCDVLQEMAYIALNTNEISVYSVKENRVLYSFISYNGNPPNQPFTLNFFLFYRRVDHIPERSAYGASELPDSSDADCLHFVSGPERLGQAPLLLPRQRTQEAQEEKARQ
jgi:hypothetical protein